MQEVSRGIDQLVALASLGVEWRERVLSDPLAAAREAELKLSDGERAIIKSVPPETLAGMIDSFARASGSRPASVGRTALRAAAAALLVTSLTGCDGCIATTGIQPDVPPAKPEKAEPPAKPREVEPAPRGSEGIRPDIPESKPREAEPAPPASKGMRADLPEEKR